jgi:hypothetical protein
MRMKNSFHVPAVLVLAFGAAALFAQDKPKKEPTSAEKLWNAIHEQCCTPKDGKCEGEQKKVCDHVAATFKAGMTSCGAKCKKEGLKCEECAKVKDGGPCDKCREMIVKTVAPWLKTQASAKDATHTVTGKDGKKETIKCTLLTGPPCKGCAEEMSDAVVTACKEANAPKK